MLRERTPKKRAVNLFVDTELLDGARRLVDRLRAEVRVGDVVISEVSAVLGVHVGPGTVGIVVSPRV